MGSVKVIAGALLAVLFAGCAQDDARNGAADITDGQVTDHERATVLILPCPSSDQTAVDLDIKGPGQPTPEQAVVPFAEGSGTVVQSGQRETRVVVLGRDGTVARVFAVSRHRDGWWPDSYTECAT